MPQRARFTIRDTEDGEQVYFTLRAENNECTLTSQMYPDAKTAIIGIKSIKRTAPDAIIVNNSSR